MTESGSKAGGLTTVLVVLGALALFVALFTTFLIVPLVVFVLAIGALIVSDRRRKPRAADGPRSRPAEPEDDPR